MLSDECKKAINYIKEIKNGIIIFEGPSGWGKTTALSVLKSELNEKMCIISDENIVDNIVGKKRLKKSDQIIINEICGEFKEYSIIGIEDIDFCLRGKACICEIIAEIINQLSKKNKTVIITGCHITKNMPELTDLLINPRIFNCNNE